MIRILDKNKCSGCFACYNKCPVNAISMPEDENGFRYPVVDETKCIKCGLCKKVCVYNNSTVKQFTNTNEPKIYAMKSLNDKNRLESSSGGIFTELSKYIFENNGVVFGAGFDKDLNVIHKAAKDIKELKELKGSKYVQSYVGKSYFEVEEFLKNDVLVMFVGTPCQIAGLYKYLGDKDYDNLYTVDLICHGVPSSKVYRKYLNELEVKNNSKISKIYFRDKEEGWTNFSIKVLFENRTQYRKNLNEDIYMKLFLRNICLRKTCYDCKFSKIPRIADITLGDYWGIKNKYPELDTDDKGISEVLINSAKGKEFINKINSKINMNDTDFQFGLSANPCIYRSVKEPKKREKFFGDLDKYSLEILKNKYCPDSNILTKVINKSKSILVKILK